MSICGDASIGNHTRQNCPFSRAIAPVEDWPTKTPTNLLFDSDVDRKLLRSGSKRDVECDDDLLIWSNNSLLLNLTIDTELLIIGFGRWQPQIKTAFYFA